MIQLAQQFRLLSSFFGLAPSNKKEIHQSIFYFIYGAPGFTFDDVYNMPVHMRNNYFQELMALKKKEKQQVEQANQQPKPTIPRQFQPKK